MSNKSQNRINGMSFRVKDNEEEKIVLASQILGVSPSALIRNAALAQAEKVIEEKNVLDPKTVSNFKDKLAQEKGVNT